MVLPKSFILAEDIPIFCATKLNAAPTFSNIKANPLNNGTATCQSIELSVNYKTICVESFTK